MAVLKLITFLLISLWNTSSLKAEVVPAKIMPLGNSITESDSGHASYRYWLWNALNDSGFSVDFVGSKSGVRNGAPLYSDFDQDHEGHWGWRTGEVLDSVGQWVQLSEPDIVLIHLGTNDINYNNGNESTINELGEIIDTLRMYNAYIKILLAQIIPGDINNKDSIPALNDSIATLGAAKNTANSPVIIVDHYTGFDFAVDTYDSIHPDSSGERKMSDAWFQALLNLYCAPEIRSTANDTATEDSPFIYIAMVLDPIGTPFISFENMPGWLTVSNDSIIGTPTEGMGDTSFTIIASDDSLSDTLVVSIVVLPVNDAPVITSSAMDTATEGAMFLYIATVTDPDDTPTVSFQNLPGWLDASGDTLTGTPDDPISDTNFQVIASDSALADTLVVSLTVFSVNDTPLANAGIDQQVAERDSLSLDGSSSTDADGDSLTYQWRQLSGPEGQFSDATIAMPVFIAPPVIETLQINVELTVADTALFSKDTVTITVNGVLDSNDYLVREYYDTAGHLLPYRLFVPPVYDNDTTTLYPLVLYLHGASKRGSDNTRQLLQEGSMVWARPEKQSDYPSFVVAPQCSSGRRWSEMCTPYNDCWDKGTHSQFPITLQMQLVFELVDSLQREYMIDANRIYVGGQSMGGYGTWDITTRRPDVFAAGVSGGGGGDTSKTDSLLHMGIWAFHGEMDSTVPVSGSRDMMNSITAKGGMPRYTEYAGQGHKVWDDMWNDSLLFPWVFSHSKGKNAPMVTSASADTAVEDSVFSYIATAFDLDSTPVISIENVPVWLNVSNDTLTGTPTEGIGDTSFAIVASDGSLADTLVVSITVLPTNDAPQITTVPETIAYVDSMYQQQIVVSDTDMTDSTFSFTLLIAPGGMSVDSMGLITWLPTSLQVGETVVSIEVTDTNGGYDTLTYNLTVVDETVPVILSAFSAWYKNNGVVLEWRTETEENNLGFNVLRSTTEHGMFSRVNKGVIPGHLTTSYSHSYSYIDATAVAGAYYYQLEQIDIDGTRSYSTIISVAEIVSGIQNYEKQEILNFFSIIQQPHQFVISITLDKPQYLSIALYDVNGNRVGIIAEQQFDNNENTITWNVFLRSGFYSIIIEGTSLRDFRKLIIHEN